MQKDAERDLNRVVECLFSVCLTMVQTLLSSALLSLSQGVLPVIRCQRLQAAEMIGQRLEEKLRQALLSPALAEQLSVRYDFVFLFLFFSPYAPPISLCVLT